MGRHAALRYLRSDALPCGARHASAERGDVGLGHGARADRGELLHEREADPAHARVLEQLRAWPASNTMSDASLHTAA